MRFRKLTIHNIASIEHAQIDFCGDILANEPLFLITGDTGSGKTTILDAVCLALYKKTPRTNADNKEKIFLTDNDSDNPTDKDSITTDSTKLLMKRNTVEAYSELEFEDNDGRLRIAKWYVARAYKKTTGKIQKEEHSIYNSATNETLVKEKDVEAEIARCTGMSFEQFCRTCMLSQGEFTRFLKSKESEKGEILEKLTDSNIYSVISKNIFDITKQKQLLLEKKKSELQSVKLLSEEDKGSLLQRISSDNELLLQKNALQGSLTQKVSYLKNLNALVDDKKQKITQLNTYNDYFNGEIFQTESRIVKLWGETVYLRGQLQAKERYTLLLNTQSKEVNNYKNRFIKLNEGLVYCNCELQTAENEYKDIDKQIQTIKNDIQTKNNEYESLNVDAKTREYQNLTKKKETLLTLKSAVLLLEKSKVPLQNSKTQIDAYQSEIQNKKRQIKDQESLLQSVHGEFQQAQMRYDKIASSLDTWAKKTRLTLAKGDTCPLCGQQIEELIKDDDFAQIVEPLSVDRNEKERLYRQAIVDCDKIKNQRQLLQKEMAKLTEERQKQQVEYDKTYKRITDLCSLSGLEVTKYLSTVEIDSLTDATQREMNLLFAQINQARELSGEIAKLHETINNLTARKQTTERLKTLINNCSEIKNGLSEWTQKWERTDWTPQKTDNLFEKWNRLKDDFLDWKNKIEALRHNVDDCTENINEFLNANSHISLDLIESLKPYNDESIRNLQQSHDEKLKQKNILQGAVNHIDSEIEKLQRTEITFEEYEDESYLQNQINVLAQEIRQLQLQTGALTNQLDEDKKNNSLYAEKLSRAEKLNKEYSAWSSLNKEFGSADGKKFRSIAQSFILGDLLDKANYYMNRFSDRYELTCQGSSLTILIKDNYEGGILTSSASLSGGESFMVSLSLALGLAKMTSNNSFSDILFIDEGFGTLSSDCLNTIMETLEKLHNLGGRKVGIISHVAELKEKIPVQIQVKRIDTTKSAVKTVKN